MGLVFLDGKGWWSTQRGLVAVSCGGGGGLGVREVLPEVELSYVGVMEVVWLHVAA